MEHGTWTALEAPHLPVMTLFPTTARERETNYPSLLTSATAETCHHTIQPRAPTDQ